MILELEEYNEPGRGYVVMPNQALPWRQLLRWYLLISMISLGVGVYFFSRGMTLVLPFSGLEVLALGFALYVSAWKSNERQVIRIGNDKVEIETGFLAPQRSQNFQRGWTQVILQPPPHPWYPSRLVIGSHGSHVEIGAFLNEQERQGLAIELKRALSQQDYPGSATISP